MFDNAVANAWRADLFQLIADTPNLDWMVLTKRIGNVGAYMQHDGLARHLIGTGRVWLGATITSQLEADRDIPKLLDVPAHLRFISMEPLLGAVTLPRLCDAGSLPGPGGAGGVMCARCQGCQRYGCIGVDWVIVGGESGRRARPMQPDWARGLRDQCAAAGVPFFFKQWGEWAPNDRGMPGARLDASGTGDHPLVRIGKKAAGRLLDARAWNHFPPSAP